MGSFVLLVFDKGNVTTVFNKCDAAHQKGDFCDWGFMINRPAVDIDANILILKFESFDQF